MSVRNVRKVSGKYQGKYQQTGRTYSGSTREELRKYSGSRVRNLSGPREEVFRNDEVVAGTVSRKHFGLQDTKRTPSGHNSGQLRVVRCFGCRLKLRRVHVEIRSRVTLSLSEFSQNLSQRFRKGFPQVSRRFPDRSLGAASAIPDIRHEFSSLPSHPRAGGSPKGIWPKEFLQFS